MDIINLIYPQRPAEPEPANSLVTAISVVQDAKSLTKDVFDALRLLSFVYAEAIEKHVSILETLLPQASTPLRDAAVWSAIDAISDYMQRYDSFPYPLDAHASEDDLIREAIDVLQDALECCIDRDMQTPKVLEALRFLMLKDGSSWQFINFWNALMFRAGHGNWQNADVALKHIRAYFHYL